MVSINKISTMRATLPAISGLAVLSGSSMGPFMPPDNLRHIPGSDFDDPFIDQFQYQGGKLIDLGQEVSTSFSKGVSNVFDNVSGNLSDLGHDISDGIGDIADKIIDLLS